MQLRFGLKFAAGISCEDFAAKATEIHSILHARCDSLPSPAYAVKVRQIPSGCRISLGTKFRLYSIEAQPVIQYPR